MIVLMTILQNCILCTNQHFPVSKKKKKKHWKLTKIVRGAKKKNEKKHAITDLKMLFFQSFYTKK
jgi:hypothetical protein